MTKRQITGFIIFSVQRSSNSPVENEGASDYAEFMLKYHKIGYKIVEGFFEGISEESFVVSLKDESLVRAMCHAFEQECYLIVDQNSNAVLHFLDGSERNIGLWQATSEAVASSYSGYTKDGKQYYVCDSKLLPLQSFKSGV